MKRCGRREFFDLLLFFSPSSTPDPASIGWRLFAIGQSGGLRIDSGLAHKGQPQPRPSYPIIIIILLFLLFVLILSYFIFFQLALPLPYVLGKG